MACAGCGSGAPVGMRTSVQMTEEGNPVEHQVRYPDGTVQTFWSKGGAENAVRDYGATIIGSVGEDVGVTAEAEAKVEPELTDEEKEAAEKKATAKEEKAAAKKAADDAAAKAVEEAAAKKAAADKK